MVGSLKRNIHAVGREKEKIAVMCANSGKVKHNLQTVCGQAKIDFEKRALEFQKAFGPR